MLLEFTFFTLFTNDLHLIPPNRLVIVNDCMYVLYLINICNLILNFGRKNIMQLMDFVTFQTKSDQIRVKRRCHLFDTKID